MSKDPQVNNTDQDKASKEDQQDASSVASKENADISKQENNVSTKWNQQSIV